jgi:hypothetical protein
LSGAYESFSQARLEVAEVWNFTFGAVLTARYYHRRKTRRSLAGAGEASAK